MVCGWQSEDTKNALRASLPLMAWNIAIASAAAVASSRSDALAMGRLVRSMIAVWKLSSASSRPCDISA
jgi:hypothetical protein